MTLFWCVCLSILIFCTWKTPCMKPSMWKGRTHLFNAKAAFVPAKCRVNSTEKIIFKKKFLWKFLLFSFVFLLKKFQVSLKLVEKMNSKYSQVKTFFWFPQGTISQKILMSGLKSKEIQLKLSQIRNAPVNLLSLVIKAIPSSFTKKLSSEKIIKRECEIYKLTFSLSMYMTFAPTESSQLKRNFN